MKIVIGCDEAAFDMKEAVHQRLKELQYDVIDVGVYDKNPSLYPDTAEKLCKEIVEGRAEKGILMCGTGIGMAITANKIPGIRAAVGHDVFSVERSRKSNNCQVLCMGARVIAIQSALMLMERWLQCEFAGGASKAKVDRIREIECQYR